MIVSWLKFIFHTQEFYKPIVTPFEMEIACLRYETLNSNVKWMFLFFSTTSVNLQFTLEYWYHIMPNH